MAEPVEGRMFEGRTFRDEDWYGEDFADRAYRNCSFLHVDMTEATSRRI